jgi:hypothetical protein
MSKRNLETGSKGAGGSAPAALGLILLLALPALQPLLRGELSCGFDTTFHLWRAVEAEALLRAGVLLPRWVPHMAYGYGYPLFLFQSPFSAQLAAVLHLVSGAAWPLVLNFTYGLGIVASGWTMWLLAREFWGDRGGILAAVAYIYAPFHAYVAYFRASLSENTAWALLPLLLWGLRRWQQTGERRGLVTAVLTLALLFYTHDVTAYAAFPLIAAWVLAHSLPGRDWAALRRGGLAWGWGFAAAAFFWLPALAERSQIQFARANSAWPFLYENNFLPWSQLFALPHNADPLLMNDWPPRGIGLVLTAAALLGLAAGWRRLPRVRPFLPWLTLALLGYLFLTISWSQPIWDGVPLLAAFQFPWRFLAPATLLAALLAGGGGDFAARASRPGAAAADRAAAARALGLVLSAKLPAAG